MVPRPGEPRGDAVEAVLRLSADARWMLALTILLETLSAWLETTAPVIAWPILLGGVALAGLVCGVAPGSAAAGATALALWGFAQPGPLRLLTFAAASALLLAGAAGLRVRLRRSD